ncbi:MAG TPA: neutral zinc metallopeptidase, partial [Dongiaceae bacterium]|nr:neutral zinc metallopeptidase [Dongiaceae bacterium]
MRWREGRRSDNVEDQRGQGLPGGMGFPGGGGVRRAGIGGFGLLIVVVVALLFGVDPSQLLQPGGVLDTGTYAPESPTGPSSGADAELRDFVSVVLADTEDTWRE